MQIVIVGLVAALTIACSKKDAGPSRPPTTAPGPIAEARPTSEARPASESVPPPDLTPPPAAAGADEPSYPWADETVGPLKIGMPATEVEKALGEPSSRGALEEEEATGDVVSRWSWKAAGVSLSMRSSSRKGALEIGAISVTGPSSFETSKAIKIGSSIADLNKAYGAHMSKDDSTDELFVAGSIYGGVMFVIKDGAVSEIFVGAAAE